MQHTVIHNKPLRYSSFPVVTRLQDGRLVCVFREAGEETARAAENDTHTHQDLDSRILMSISDQEGLIWGEPVEVARSGEYALSDPSILILSDGTWMVRVARWKLVPSRDRHLLQGPIHRHYVRTGQVGMLAGNGYFISHDEGCNWTSLPSKVLDLNWQYAVSREAPLELEDGSLLQAVYGGWPETTECAAVVKSFDGGCTWGDAARLAGDRRLGHSYRSDPNFNEVSLVALDTETIFALIRCDTTFITDTGDFCSEGGMGKLYWSVSFDAGMTWEPPKPTDLWGQPAQALYLGGGQILCTFGYRNKPFGVQAALCCLKGNEFQTVRKIVLRDDSVNWDCGYPCSVHLGGEDIFSAYYINLEDRVRQVVGTRWSLQEMTIV